MRTEKKDSWWDIFWAFMAFIGTALGVVLLVILGSAVVVGIFTGIWWFWGWIWLGVVAMFQLHVYDFGWIVPVTWQARMIVGFIWTSVFSPAIYRRVKTVRSSK